MGEHDLPPLSYQDELAEIAERDDERERTASPSVRAELRGERDPVDPYDELNADGSYRTAPVFHPLNGSELEQRRLRRSLKKTPRDDDEAA